MRKLFLATILVLSVQQVFARETVGPEGGKLLWILAGFMLLMVLMIFSFRGKRFSLSAQSLLKPGKKISIEISTDRRYYPDYMKLVVKNTGRKDVDLENPLLIFDSFWLKRKFRLTGLNNYRFYPLLLGKGETHELNIDINRFYRHDNRLKRFPKVKVVISETGGRRLGSRSIFLRKTLFKY